MRKKLLVTLSALALAATMSAGLFTLTACGNKDKDKDGEQEQQNLTDKELEGEVLADWSEGKAKAVFESDGWTNGSVFNTQWSANNVSYENGAMKLSITDNPTGSEATNNQYFGGEGRTYQYFGYGDYEVCMKPSSTPGTCSAFFTCTGDYDTNPETGKSNPWDEIDIEFLGSDTTRVQFNFYQDGKNRENHHEYWYDLGFDASEDFHEYGFRWTKDYIVWFVDNEPVYKVENKSDDPIPSTPGRILMNHWVGTEQAEGWMGEYHGSDQAAEYKWVRTSAQAEWGELPGDTEPDDGDDTTGEDAEEIVIENLAPIDLSAVTLEGNIVGKDDPVYTATVADGSLGISYTNVGGSDYKKVELQGISSLLQEKNVLTATIVNNGTEAVNLRINLTANQVGDNWSCNLSASQDGKVARTDTQWGGSFFTIEPDQTVNIQIVYDNTRTLNSIEFMADSSVNDTAVRSGDITISELKLGTCEISGGEEEGGSDETPVTPPVGNNQGININGAKHEVEGNVYTVNTSEDGNDIEVTYSNLVGGHYDNVNIKNIKTVAGDKTTLKFTVKNNGTENVTMRVDVIGEKVVNVTNNHHICNTSATIDGEAAATDLAWGGSTFTLAAGETYEIEVVYDAKYVPASLQIMLDSSVYNDTATHSGDVTISDITFSGTYTPEAGGEGSTENPVTPGDATEQALTFGSNAGYNVSQSGVASTSVDVTYDGLQWAYCNITADIATYAAGNNTFSVKIKNNGTTAVVARFDIQGTNDIDTNIETGAHTDACYISATAIGGSDLRTDTNWGGTFITVAANEEVTLTITYDNASEKGAIRNLLVYLDSNDPAGYATASGDVTLSGFSFSNVTAE